MEDPTEKVTFEQSPETRQGERDTAIRAKSILGAVKQMEIHPGGSMSSTLKEKQGGQC